MTMEFIFVLGALALAVLIASLFQCYISSTSREQNTDKNKLPLPPGSTGWPVMGESLDYLPNMQKLQQEKFYLKRMIKYSSRVFKTSLFGDHFTVLGGVEGSKLLFSSSNKLVVREFTRAIRKILFTREFEVTFDRYTKPAILAFLKGEGLNNSVGVMDTMAQIHVQSWQSQEIMMYPSVKKYLFALACRLFLSIENHEVVDKLFIPMEILSAGILAIPINLPGTPMNRAIKAAAALKLHIRLIVKQQRSEMESNSFVSTQKNMLSYLIQAQEDDDIVSEAIVGLLVAGYETSSSVLCMTFKVLTDYQHIYHKVYEENMELTITKKPDELLSREDTNKMRYTWNVIREVMRLYTFSPFICREAIVDFTFAGFHIPKGYKLITSTYALHKDPKNFQDPEKFDPSRFDGDGPLPYTYIPFGGGSFVCSGRTYAQLAMLVFIHNVVKRFKWESVVPNEKIVGIPHPKPAKGLPLRFYPHEN